MTTPHGPYPFFVGLVFNALCGPEEFDDLDKVDFPRLWLATAVKFYDPFML